jgi:hypothetical protein
MKSKLLKISFGISIFFILSATFNYGMTRYYLAIPFMGLALYLSKKIFKSKQIFFATIVLCIVSILLNNGLEKSSLIFPILSNGYVEVHEDGYLLTYSDGSGSFSKTGKIEFECTGCGKTTSHKVFKDERYPVLGVSIRAGLSTKVGVRTNIGIFSAGSFRDQNISTNKNIESTTFKWLGNAMYFPVAILASINEIDGILPGTLVLVEDDFGNIREATLSRVVTKGRSIKKGDKVRLDCSKKIKLNHSKGNYLCSLEFPNSKPKAGAYNNKVPAFSVAVDPTGTPINLIIYH